MAVGGPNNRRDFHIEMGEEIFYQIKGGMDLDIVVNDSIVRIHIREGEYFLLHAGIPHSPQRYPNSIGIVFERDRSEKELDCMRWYKENGSDIEYEEYFHCKDLGTQIKQVIENFHNFSVNNKCQPSSFMSIDSKSDQRSFERMKSDLLNLRNDHLVSNPQNFNEEIMDFMANTSHISRVLIDSEFRLSLLKPQHPSILSEEFHIINERKIGNESNHFNTAFLWQLKGESDLNWIDRNVSLKTDEVTMVNLSDIELKKIEQNRSNDENSCLIVLSNRCT